jgi:ribosomal protein S18 acetylase RimI-like enzyme
VRARHERHTHLRSGAVALADRTFRVRAMEERDLEAVGQLAGRLVRMHHAFDPQRFLRPVNPERGYARWFASELQSPDRDKEIVLLVAETEDGAVAGYAYARLEPRSYNELLDAHGKLHDVYVDESARQKGIGEALVREAIRRLEAMGAPRTVLLAAAVNEAAQRLFARLGFRTTMLEMTRDAPRDPRRGESDASA